MCQETYLDRHFGLSRFNAMVCTNLLVLLYLTKAFHFGVLEELVDWIIYGTIYLCTHGRYMMVRLRILCVSVKRR